MEEYESAFKQFTSEGKLTYNSLEDLNNRLEEGEPLKFKLLKNSKFKGRITYFPVPKGIYTVKDWSLGRGFTRLEIEDEKTGFTQEMDLDVILKWVNNDVIEFLN